MKKFIIILISVSSISLALFATRVQIVKSKQDKTSTYNEIDNKYKADVGWAYYQDQNQSSKKNIYTKNCCENILKVMQKMLKEEQKQTKIQNKILEILQKRMDPQPHYIVRNGKKCIANSSADCFEMPITAAAQRVPALYNWMKNPSMANTVNFLQWEAKYFKELYIRADSFPLAVNEFGKKAYPLDRHGIGYTNLQGFNIENLKMKKIINSTSKRYDYLIFFGMNRDLDITSILNLKSLLFKYPNLKFILIFKDQTAKSIFYQTVQNIYSKYVLKKIDKMKNLVDKSEFSKYQIFTTPSIVAVDLKKHKAQTICNGKIEVGYFEEQMYNYLEYSKELNYDDTINYLNWDKNVNFRENYYKNLLGIDINKILKKEKLQ